MQAPKSYAQASKNPIWIESMHKELKALKKNDAWTLAELPPNKNVVDHAWKYKFKYNPDGTINKP